MPPYPQVPQQPDLPGLEQRVLDWWRTDDTFRASVEQRDAGTNEYVFYDGPPFANGLPHYGHILTGYVKDVVPRYQTMRGRRVERRFGWDCHGLPAEVETEKELGISGHSAIEDFGVERFNEMCRRSVLRYTQEWESYVTRQARWVDFTNDYKTLDLSYMESVMWAFKQLWDKGLVYEGYKVVPYCWECETPLSNFETRLDDAYRDRQDPAITVLFELEPESGINQEPEKVLVWTTTPWTLPSNLALAVGPDIDYAVFEEDGIRYLIGESTTAGYERELRHAHRRGIVRGRDLVGRRYRPLFPYFAHTPNAFTVLAADFVNTDEGTGVVHVAPGFGEDDQRLGEAHAIPVVVPVDEHARFTAEVSDYAGQQVFEANAAIIADLKARGSLIRHDSYVHAYPHCWRTNTPLIYRGISSWFIRVTDIRGRALELNQEITWVPGHIRDGAFGKGLENAPDWAVSRNRFWGSPIPVWKSDDPAYPRVDVYGSLDELEGDFGVRLTDLHRPGIDQLTRPNPDDPTGRSTMRRVEEVLDCWFESGSMPFAQVHYPFENREWFETHFPADFIVEYIAQTRGWFYTLHILATALMDRPAFRTCVVHGVLLDDDGQKLSKRSRNYPDPTAMFDRYGSDALRWFLMSSPILRGGDAPVEEQAIAGALRQVIHPLWNAWHFFALYANTDGYAARWRTDAAGVLDRYVLAKTRTLVAEVTERMDAYDLAGACWAISAYLDALTNWYIRRSRDRFWESDADAFDTLYTVLEVVARVSAPLLPMVSEEMWQGLTGGRSVHLVDWPSMDELPADDTLVSAMDRVRDICSAAHSVRKAQGLRARLPLASLVVASPDAAGLEPYRELIEDEVNVKDIRLESDVTSAGELTLQVVPSVLGPRIGPDVQKVIKAVRAGQWERRPDGSVEVAGRTLEDDEYSLRLVPRDSAAGRALPGDKGVVVLDLAVTPELEAEGLARDVARLVNEARRSAGLHVADRIHLVIDVGSHHDVAAALTTHHDYVRTQTLATDLVLAGPITESHRGQLPDGRAIHIGFSAVART